MPRTKMTKYKFPKEGPAVNVQIKCKVQIVWHEKHTALILDPIDWTSAVWMSRFHLASEAIDNDDLSTAAMGPVGNVGADGKYHEEDWPISTFYVALLPFRKPKKIAELRRLRDRKMPAEPKRTSRPGGKR